MTFALWGIGAQRTAATAEESERPIRVQLLNSGRGIEVWLEGGPKGARPLEAQEEQLILSQGPLSYAYKLFKIELHSAAKPSQISSVGPPPPFGSGGPTGERVKSSEHSIAGRSFDGELQLHFYNRHLAASLAEAQQHLSAGTGATGSLDGSFDGGGGAGGSQDARPSLFAAIAVFLVASENATTATTPAPGGPLDFVLDNLGAIANEGSAIELELGKRQLEALLTSRRQYITYQGSLNRPPCAEGVDWILLNRALRIEGRKLAALFSSERLNTNQENVRPVKALNNRLLRTTISLSPATALPGSSTGRRRKQKQRQRLRLRQKQQKLSSLSNDCSLKQQQVGANKVSASANE